MVRFNRNRWYSNENQQQMRRQVAGNSNGTRRLISLVFLLALVLLLMQKVSDPKNVRRAFQSIGVSLDQESVANSEPNGVEVSSDSLSPKFSIEDSQLDAAWLVTCRDLLPRILNASSTTSIDLLARYTFGNPESRWHTLQPTELTAEVSSLAGTAQTLVDQFSTALLNQSIIEDDAAKPEASSSWEDPSQISPAFKDGAIWGALLQRFEVEWSKVVSAVEQFHLGEAVDENSGFSASPELRLALEETLDAKLMARLNEAAPWSQSEYLSFWRLLQRCRTIDYGPDIEAGRDQPDQHLAEITDDTPSSFSKPLPLISTQQLQADFEKRRGKWLRFHGTVHRVEFVQRPSPLFDAKGYWILWLQGADGASQPVGVFTQLEYVSEFEQAVSMDEFPEVELVGLVGKRLAYASQSGVQISPTIFAGSIRQIATQIQPTDRDSAMSDKNVDATQITTAMVTALALSCLAVLAVWRTFHRNNWGRGKLSAQSKQKRTLGPGSVIGLLCVLTSQEQAISCQLSPPWANSTDESRTIAGVAEQLLSAAFNEEAWQNGTALPSQNGQFATDDVLKIMHACERIGWEQVYSIHQGISLGNEYILRPMQVDGWARHCRMLRLTEGQQNWFSKATQSAVFELNVTSGLSENNLPPIYCISVPKFWLDADELAQPTIVKGLVLLRKKSDSPDIEDQAAAVCMFVERPQWRILKQSTGAEMKIRPELSASWRELADLGWNLTWIDQLLDRNEESLANSEREPFSSLLQIVDQAEFEPDSKVIEPMELLRSSKDHVGCCVDWKVRLVAGNLVQYPGPQDGKSLTYYQFDGFVKIPGQRVDYIPAQGHERIRFEGEFPVTIVMASVSEFVPKNLAQSGVISWRVGKHAQLKGRFYRMWSYRSERLEDDSAVGRQIAPLIIGASLIPALPDTTHTGPMGWFGAAMGIGVLLVLAGIIAMVFKDTFRSPS